VYVNITEQNLKDADLTVSHKSHCTVTSTHERKCFSSCLNCSKLLSLFIACEVEGRFTVWVCLSACLYCRSGWRQMFLSWQNLLLTVVFIRRQLTGRHLSAGQVCWSHAIQWWVDPCHNGGTEKLSALMPWPVM